MSPDAEQTGSEQFDTHIGAAGLWIPPEYREFTTQVVIRTPRLTIQHFESGESELEPYLGTVDGRSFGPAEEIDDPKNAQLAPNKVSIMPQGEDPEILSVELREDDEPEIRADGGEPAVTERSPMPASRLAAELSKSSSVRLAKRQFEYRLWVTTTDDGFSRGELRTIREYGWRVSGFDHRRNGVSIVREDRFRVAADGGDCGV